MRLTSLIALCLIVCLLGSAWPGTTLAQTPATQPADPSPPPETQLPTAPRDKLGTLPAVGENVEAVKTYARGEYAKAAKMLEPAYRAGRAGIQDRLILSRAYLHTDRPDDALAVLKNVLESDPENPEANSLAGQLLQKAGKNKEALKCLQHAYRLKPEAVTAGALGRCYYELGNLAKAKTYLTSALTQDIRDPSYSLLLGRIHLDRGGGALAEKYLLMAQEAGLDSKELHLLLGRAYLLQHKFTGPVLAKRLSGKVKVDDVIDGEVVLAKAPGQTGKFLVATRYCALHEGLQLLKGNKRDGDGLYMAATGCSAAGEYDRAMRHLQTMSAKDQARPEVRDLQARLLVVTKRFGELRKFLAEGKRTGGFDARVVADYLCKAAAVLRSEGKRRDAIAMLKRAEAEQPVAESVLRPLAGLYVAVGDDKRAAEYYARLVELLPDAEDIDELNNTLKVLREKTEVTK